jgi:magnesium chelatase subunit D
VTDGRHTSGEHPARVAAALAGQGVASVVVDCESGPVRLGMALTLAEHLGAEYLRLEDLAAAPLASLVRQRRAG